MPLSTQNQITIEKTPTYILFENAAKQILMLDKNMKFIITLRDPVERIISHYTDYVTMNFNYKGNQTYPPINEQTNDIHNEIFEEFVFKKKSVGERFLNSQHEFVVQGFYIKFIKMWLKYFPIKNLIFLNEHEFNKNPITEIDRLQKFLGIKRLITDEHYKYDEVKGFNCMKIPIDSNNYTCLGDDKGRRNPVIYQQTIDKLKRLYAPSDEELFKFLNVKPFW
jgi:[heparan sulfate]-glucosamine 3-sulfotransferase 3